MPELPEVEAARLLCEEALVGLKLVALRAMEDTKLFGPAAGADLSAALVGRTLRGAHRHGKHLWLDFGGDGRPGPPACLALHFGMTGAVAVRGVGQVQYVNARPIDGASWPPPFTKLELDFVVEAGGKNGGGGGGGKGVVSAAYVDPRRFGKVRLVADPTAGLPAGRDVLTDPPSPADLAAALGAAGATKKIKPLLMDQTFLAGVGNWVADEVLWASRIHPEAGAATLSESQVGALASALRDVVATAVAARADDSRYPRSWIFHSRWGKAAGARVNGHPISFIDVGGRTTAYVPGLQKKGVKKGDGGGVGGRGGGGGGGGRSAKREAAPSPPPPPPPPPRLPPAKRVKVEPKGGATTAGQPIQKKGAAAKPRAAAKSRAGAAATPARGGRGGRV